MIKVEIIEVTTVRRPRQEWVRLRSQTDNEKSGPTLGQTRDSNPEFGYANTFEEVERERVMLLQVVDSIDLAKVIAAVNHLKIEEKAF